MKILVVDHFEDYMKEHLDWFHRFLQEGNIIVSRHNTIYTDPVAWWEQAGPVQKGTVDEEHAKYNNDYLWYRLLEGVNPAHFINFNEENGYPTHLDIVSSKGRVEVKEKPFKGIAYDPTSGVSHLQELFHFISKTYPDVTLSNLYFASEEEDYFKEVKQAKGHCIRIFRPEGFRSVLTSNFFQDYGKEKNQITSILRPKVNLEGVWSCNVLFAPVEGILEGSRMYEEKSNLDEVKKRLTQFILEGNILVLFTSLQELPTKQFERLYAILEEIVMTTSLPSVFLFQKDLAGWQFGSRSRFEKDRVFAENEIVQKMVGENECILPFGWHEEKNEIIIPFLRILKMQGIYVKGIFAVGENVMEDASLLEQVRSMGGTAAFIIPGDDPGEILAQSMKRYEYLDKVHVDKFSAYLEGSVKNFETFMDQNVLSVKGNPPQPDHF